MERERERKRVCLCFFVCMCLKQLRVPEALELRAIIGKDHRSIHSLWFREFIN